MAGLLALQLSRVRAFLHALLDTLLRTSILV
jgi:hypothetical protein